MSYDGRAIASLEALSRQPGGSHYKDMAIQPVEFITANDIAYREANVIKYVCRHKAKNGREDLEKAMHYLEMLLESYEDDHREGIRTALIEAMTAPEPTETPQPTAWSYNSSGEMPVAEETIVDVKAPTWEDTDIAGSFYWGDGTAANARITHYRISGTN